MSKRLLKATMRNVSSFTDCKQNKNKRFYKCFASTFRIVQHVINKFKCHKGVRPMSGKMVWQFNLINQIQWYGLVTKCCYVTSPLIDWKIYLIVKVCSQNIDAISLYLYFSSINHKVKDYTQIYFIFRKKTKKNFKNGMTDGMNGKKLIEGNDIHTETSKDELKDSRIEGLADWRTDRLKDRRTEGIRSERAGTWKNSARMKKKGKRETNPKGNISLAIRSFWDLVETSKESESDILDSYRKECIPTFWFILSFSMFGFFRS